MQKPPMLHRIRGQQVAQRLRHRQSGGFRIMAQGVEDLVELFDRAEGQIDQQELASLEHASTPPTAAKPIVADLIAQSSHCIQRVFQGFHRMHPCISINLAGRKQKTEATPRHMHDYNPFGSSRLAEFDDTDNGRNLFACMELRQALSGRELETKRFGKPGQPGALRNTARPNPNEEPIVQHLEPCETTSLEQQVQFLKTRLAEAQKLTALGELVSTTTHEFNNVLMTIINYAKLGMRHRDAATRDKAFDKILAAGNRAAKITNTVLGLARNRSAGMEATDLTQLVEDALLLLEREMNKYRIRVEKQFRTIPEAMVNGNQIQQVLLNLLINARQSMPNGGRLLIKLSHDPQSDMIELVVRDYGSGIPPEKLPHIFDAFYTTKDGPDTSGKGGTGLGLSTCRDIIESHHGRIRVDSSVGKGTAITLRLPPAKPAPRAKSFGAPVCQQPGIVDSPNVSS